MPARPGSGAFTTLLRGARQYEFTPDPTAPPCSNAVGRVLLGIGSMNRNPEQNGVGHQLAALPPRARAAIVGVPDAHTFLHPHTGRRWTFILFNSVGMCVLAHTHFVLNGAQI
jgi:hypothetical protein